ncbi:MAG: SurA N-terminal domain-containing protein [Bacteroidales bacterium]|nr:SurA N-terminal domain-containing protein [Bacteroidales bacterium]
MLEFIKEHKIGIIGTVIFHIIIVSIFMIFGYSTPLPLPEEEGILINFGDSDNGRGKQEPIYSKTLREQEVEEIKETKPEPTPKETTEGLTTQDFEDAPVVKEEGKEEIKKEKKDKAPEPKPKKDNKEKKKERKKERKVNKNALFPGRDRSSTSNSSEGETQGNGNQGSTTGSVDSKNHTGGSSMGKNGTSFSLAGRNPEALPKPSYNQQIEGKVVVEITVDKYGKVTDANPGVKGSTTLDASLLAAAKRAALKARFDKKPDAPAFQKGTITYYFKLQ